MEKNHLISHIQSAIQNKEMVAPYLFLGNNLANIHLEIRNLTSEIFDHFWGDKNYFFTLEDNEQSIKVEEVRQFIAKSHIRSSFPIQIFLIENISRLTTQSSNALLKFLEEPGVWNIIFLTNTGENRILETILSRVQEIHTWGNNPDFHDKFFENMIKKLLEKKDTALLSYLYTEKLEKHDYLTLLETLLSYCQENFVFIDKMDMIEESINAIHGNANPKYQTDKIFSHLF